MCYCTQNKYVDKDIQILDTYIFRSVYLDRWINVYNHTNYLVFDNKMNKLTGVSLVRLFHKIFDGRKVSVDILRHSYLTHVYGGIEYDVLEDRAKAMGHSVAMSLRYVKK